MADFFISYNKADRKWAEWIDFQLREAQFTTITQAYDFKPGGNFILDMHKASIDSKCTIAVLSEDYLKALYTQPEWTAAFVQDPTSENAQLLPIRVQECEPTGMLRAIVYIDLVGLDEDTAKGELKTQVDKIFHGQSGRPTASPSYPGGVAEKKPVFPADLPWSIPLKRNPFFTGRDEPLEKLENHLKTGGAAALSGLGGVGKTQIAAEYAYRHRGDYQAILWTNASSQDNLTSSFIALAVLLNLPEKDAQDQEQTLVAVKRWLTSTPDYLLILDNADDLKLAQSFVPPGRKGHLLLTTRAQAIGILASKVEIRKMPPEEGARFLLRRVKRIGQDAPLEEATASDQTEALAITQELGGLPLALDQAGAYIEETGCSLADYLEIYQIHGIELLKERGDLVEKDHPDPVAVTWALSLEKIEEANPAAAELLNLCAFLHPDAIPEEIFSEGAEELGPILSPVAANAFKLNAAIKEVLKYSLLRRDSGAKTLDIHRLVQVVLQKAMDEAIKKQWAERAVRVINRLFPEPNFSMWSKCERFLSQVQICAELIEHWGFDFNETARLLNQAGFYLKLRARYSQAELLYEQALAIRKKVLGENNLDIGQSLHNLAELYHDQARYNEAEPLYKQALSIREKGQGPEHPDIAQNINNLARLFQAKGHYSKAEPLYKQALAMRIKLLGNEHPDVAQSLNNLAEFYRIQKHYSKAKPLYERAISIREKVLGMDHPDVAICLNNLALLYYGQSKYRQAESYYKQALSIMEGALGEEHPDVAISLNNLAVLCDQQGKSSEAESLYKRALAISQKTLGKEHPNVATSLSNLALLYFDKGRYDEAEPLYKQALSIQERTLGQDHPDVATCLENYAAFLRKITREEEAIKLEGRAKKIRGIRARPLK